MGLKSTTALTLLLILVFISCTPKQEAQGIAYLPKTPQIDGLLDTDLSTLEKKEFNLIWQFNNPVTDTVPLSYRMGYTASHLYVYIEAETDSIHYRRRGYVNGDGFMLLLGIPQADSLTNEYYNLYFSASKDKDYWAKEYIAGYNFKANFNKKFTEATVSREQAVDGKTGFEALIAWKDIRPYHPWFLDKMGYNLYFAKAIGDTITNGYAVVEDEGIWDEEIPKRNFAPISFQEPGASVDEIILVQPAKRNLILGEGISLKTATIASGSRTKTLNLALSYVGSHMLKEKTLSIEVGEQFKQDIIPWKLDGLIPGAYQLSVLDASDTLTQTELVVLPKMDFSGLQKRIDSNTVQLTSGTVNTLQFNLDQIRRKVKHLKAYETGKEILTDWAKFQEEYQVFLTGTDPYESNMSPYRRAFKSVYDGSYQPYTLKLPEDFDPNKTYPLLVYLHGSGQDEQGILNRPRSNGKFIEIAPLGRDIFRAYSSDSSQKDIVEAIEDVKAHFPIDANRIIIGGFSMGGYGALRTYYEHPELYKGVAVFAGHPNLANYWGVEGTHPNFLDKATHTAFEKVPVFIYHGKKDGAIPVYLMENLSESFQNSGISVTERIVAEKGHEYPDKVSNDVYFQWLDNIIED